MSDSEPLSLVPSLLLKEQLCFALYSASHAFARRYKPYLDRLGLTYPQFLCLLVLWEEDGLTVKAIGGRLLLDSGTLTPLLKRLESAGLLMRCRDKRDERQVRVTLTQAGRSLRRSALDIPEEIRCASGRSAEEMERLRVAVAELRDALNAPSPDA